MSDHGSSSSESVRFRASQPVPPPNSAGGPGGAHDGDPASANGAGHGPAAFERLGRQFAEFKEYAAFAAGIKLDKVKASVRTIGLYAALGLVGLIVAVALIAAAAVLLLGGIAGGLGELFARPWLGNLLTGLVFLTVLGVGLLIAMKKMTATFQQATVKRYEERKQTQRAQFGHDVDQAAANTAATKHGP